MNIPSGGGGSAKGGFEAQKALQLIYRHFWVILVTFLVVTISGLLFFHEKQEPQYEATTVVMVRPSTTGTLTAPSDAMHVWAAVLDMQRYRSTQLKIMPSSVILSKVVKKLELEHDLAFPSGEIDEDQAPLSLTQLVNILKKNVTVQQEGDTMMVNIKAKCAVPHYCADIANAVAKVYIEFNVVQLVGSCIAEDKSCREMWCDTTVRVITPES